MIKLVIFDWAGTSIDFGCIAPVYAFKQSFQEAGIDATFEEIRKPMGMLKIDHIRTMFKMPSIQEQFYNKNKRKSNDDDIKSLYENFEKILFQDLSIYTDPIPGVLKTVEQLRNMKIKIGSTTGYTSKMMKVVATEAKRKGYSPDFLATADTAGKGRPHPNMIQLNMKFFEIEHGKEVLKIGDTISDILEGKNAGCISAGVIEGSSELGLSKEEFEQCDKKKLQQSFSKVQKSFMENGADHVLQNITELPSLIQKLDKS